ncbi:MAG: LPS assembly lipoprotein LptE, partial [Chitinophagales bacterium]|nr:LPS assembly lipoprotein LptE [Chitinophagales bacterium]
MRYFWPISVVMIFAVPGCKIYSFSGATIPPEVKTIQIDLFQNRAGNGPALLSQIFTDRLKNKFITESRLKQTQSNGDLHIKGYISGFQYSNQAPTAAVSSGINRLTITVYVEFINNKDP